MLTNPNSNQFNYYVCVCGFFIGLSSYDLHFFVFFEKILLVQLLRGSSDKKKLDDRRPPQFFPSDAANSDNRII